MNLYALFPFVALLLVSCGSTTTSRIEKNPELYQKLSTKTKTLVDKGRITRGMSKEAVFLAWGKPASKGGGENSKGQFERWTYTTLEPVYSNSIHAGFGRGFRRGFGRGRGHSRFGRRGFGRGFSHGFSTGVHYVPRPSAWVNFKDNRVTDWQRGLSGRGGRNGFYY